MWEFKFYSRGGQGAVTAAKILINAAIIEGKFGQAIPSYGQERKGAPVYTYARIADDPINVKSYVYRPNCVICFDTSLKDLDIDITEGVRPGSTLVVNTDEVDYVNSSFDVGCPGQGHGLCFPGQSHAGCETENSRKGW